jgi:hypothetical protein
VAPPTRSTSRTGTQRERDERYRTLLETLPWGPRQPIWEHDVRDDLARERAGAA